MKEYNRRKRDFRNGKRKPGKKTEYERERTREEVRQIKKALLNYAKTEWGKKWVRSLLSIGRPFRMRRGINYAEDESRISNLSITKGQIFSNVQGTAPTPYRIKIKFQQIPEDGWDHILSDLSEKSLNLFYLLDGRLPEEIIEIFQKHDYPLFVDAQKEKLNAKCSCPDQEVPCKHIAATILYIARVLDYNPFLLLELRGKSKDEILSSLRLSKSYDTSQEKTKKLKKTQNNTKFAFSLPEISMDEAVQPPDGEDFGNIIGFKFKKLGKYIETLENAGLPPMLEDPVAFETVLEQLYRKVSARILKKAMEIEN